VVIAAAFCAPAAQAGLISGLTQIVLPTCGATSQPFQTFGDLNSYYAVPNNGLENGSIGWTLGYGGGAGSRSLVLKGGASAYSPPACINLLDPHARAFAKSNGANAGLRVQVIFYGLLGNTLGILNVTEQNAADFPDWRPTGTIPSALALPLATAYFRVKFTSLASTGTWQVDDLFVDPWGMRG
jgi:hypothetical protein